MPHRGSARTSIEHFAIFFEDRSQQQKIDFSRGK